MAKRIINIDEEIKKLEEETGITYTMCNRILQTLPLSFYLGRDIKAFLSETGKESFYNMLEDTITISYPMMLPMMKNCTSEYDREGIVRGILYHEISHAMWSPATLMGGLDNFYCQVMNVFCDERIENYNANFFMNVDFKKNIILLNDYHGEEPQNGFQAFYHAVRFRQTDDKTNDMINNIIERYTDITNTGTDEDYYGRRRIDSSRIRNYQREVRNLFIKITKPWMEENQKDKLEQKAKETYGDKSKMGMPGSGSGGSTPGSGKGEGNPGESNTYDELTEAQKEDIIERVLMGEGPDTSLAGVGEGIEGMGPKDGNPTMGGKWHKPYDDDEECEKQLNRMSNEGMRNCTDKINKEKRQNMLNTLLNTYINEDLTQKIDMIFMNFLARSKNNGSAIERYSGILDPRLLATRDDWRIWKYKADKGNIKGYDKLHLNLFIDTSGSYCSNEKATNTILKSLTELEKRRPFFSFDLVTMQRTETLRDKTERYIQASGGNDLDDKIRDIYQRLQKPDSFNYNIVLFDGDAFTDTPRGQYDAHHKNFGVFNNHKTSIISDTDNEKTINQYAPLAHSIFVGYGYDNGGKSYSELLYENILTAIHRALL